MRRRLTVLSVYGDQQPGTRLAISNRADAGSPDVTFVVNKASTGIRPEGCRRSARHTVAHTCGGNQPQPE
jgi:hypothetical protein